MPGTEKSDGAFRTIREVADWLAVPTHVLRFWESKFEQIAPVKGAGGRRYYRPEDMRLLGGIKVMLHDQGLTVRGVGQKIEEDGVETVMTLSPDLATMEGAPARKRRVVRAEDEVPPATSETVVAFAPKGSKTNRNAPEEDASDEAVPVDDPVQPDAPTPDADPEQPTDVNAPPQPVEDIRSRPQSPPQPDPGIDLDAAPGHAPDPVATDERGVTSEPWQPTVPDVADAEAAIGDPPGMGASTGPAAPAPGTFGPQEIRQLRRIVRKLRGLIAEVEDDLSRSGKS